MDLKEKIKFLKEKKEAIILSHNYQLPEVQNIADFVGDSLDLSRKAKDVDAKVIVFCGVHFMAEVASILSPEKTVLLPDKNAGCPLADMITRENLIEMKKKHPNAKVVTYINSSAEIKAESDYCCTSANAFKIVESISSDEIIFCPDKFLGDYVARKSSKKIILWNGYCPTHNKILAEDIIFQREKHKNAKVLVHAECRREVVDLADEVLSTNGMVKYVKEKDAEEFIIGTEIGIIHRLKKENPEKKFYPASELAICPNMKLINLEKIVHSLEQMTHIIKVSKQTAEKAKECIDKMLKI